MAYKIIQGDCIETVAGMPERSVHTCVTSPPYFGLRDYGVDGQTGLEATPEAFVAKLVEVFREVRRVLRDDGTVWLNLGDSYWGGKGKSGQAWSTANTNRKTLQKTHHQISGKGETRPTDGKHAIIKPKDLIGIPWRVAFALQADGWYLRQDIIWHKPNPMPESVRDRCTKSHEYIFLLSKSAKYYYDHEAIKEPSSQSTIQRMSQANLANQRGSDRVPGKTNGTMKTVGDGVSRNKRSVWTVTTKPFKGAHFATFPSALIEPCVLAGCPEGGTVLDPFTGSGTTGMVAVKHGRSFVGCELNPEYIEIAKARIASA